MEVMRGPCFDFRKVCNSFISRKIGAASKGGAVQVDHFLRLEVHAQTGAIHVAIELDAFLIAGDCGLARCRFSGKKEEGRSDQDSLRIPFITNVAGKNFLL